MKFSKTAITVAALAMATTGALAFTSKDVEAAGVATVKSYVARLYTANGDLIKNRALGANSPWQVGKTVTINGETYYQVATNEYLKARDASYQNAVQSQPKLSGKVVGGYGLLYRDDTKKLASRVLANGSTWLIGKHIVNKYGQHFVQVSSHEYADGTMMLFNMPVPEATYIADFGETVSDQNDWNDSSSDNSDIKVDTNTNNNNSDNSNVNVDTNTNTDNSNSSSTTTDYKPDLNQINKYFVEYLNALHKANGTQPVQLSSDLISYATQRAQQQNGLNLDHSTAARNMSENLEGGGYSYMKYVGVKSDKDAAYYMLKSWYDEDSNYAGAGQPGHFGHRAALIYSGPNVGLGITDSDAAFEADWNYANLDAQNQLYDFTGTNPDTHFISKDAI